MLGVWIAVFWPLPVPLTQVTRLGPSWIHMRYIIQMNWWSLRSLSTTNWTANIWKNHYGSSCMLWHVFKGNYESYFTHLPSETNNMSPQKIENILSRGYGGHQCLSQRSRELGILQWNQMTSPVCISTTDEIKLYNKLVMYCAQRWSLVILIVTCVISLEFACNLSAVPDPERGCQSIECSWMGDIYFDFSKPPKEKTNIREEIGIFQTYICSNAAFCVSK